MWQTYPTTIDSTTTTKPARGYYLGCEHDTCLLLGINHLLLTGTLPIAMYGDRLTNIARVLGSCLVKWIRLIVISLKAGSFKAGQSWAGQEA